MSSYSLLARLSTANLKISAGMPPGPKLYGFCICIVARWTSSGVGRISSNGFSECCGMDRMVSSVTTDSRLKSSSKCLSIVAERQCHPSEVSHSGTGE